MGLLSGKYFRVASPLLSLVDMSIQNIKQVTARAAVPRRSRTQGLSIAQLHGQHLPESLDPFLAIDHFEMSQPFFPPHPHAGFSAVTYMFPESRNGFVNRDSRGERIEIRPGDLHWTAAGRGILHEEVPIVRGIVCHGLQIFVNLPASMKWMAPQILHLDAAAVPLVRAPGVEVRVVCGRDGDVRSPLQPPTDVTLLDAVLEPGGLLSHEVPAGESRFLYVLKGEIAVGPPEQAVHLKAGEAAGLSAGGNRVQVRAETAAHLVLAGGRPLGEPVVFHGPFCMTSRQEIARAVRAYETGQMGHLEASF